jgi:hypothetical protein
MGRCKGHKCRMVHTRTHLLRRHMHLEHKRTLHGNSFFRSSVPWLSLLWSGWSAHLLTLTRHGDNSYSRGLGIGQERVHVRFLRESAQLEILLTKPLGGKKVCVENPAASVEMPTDSPSFFHANQDLGNITSFRFRHIADCSLLVHSWHYECS